MKKITLKNDVKTTYGEVLEKGSSHQWVDCDAFGLTHYIYTSDGNLVGINHKDIAEQTSFEIENSQIEHENLKLFLSKYYPA